MIVLAILVLLIAMVGPRLLKQQDKADLQITKQQIDSVEQALDFYKVDNRTYPTSEEGITALVSKPADEGRSRNWDGPYLENEPLDPWGNKLQYEYPPKSGTSDKPQIWSIGADGKENTDDDVRNWDENQTSGDVEQGTANTNKPASNNPQPTANN
jgi:general secretion pathway protein G